MRWDDDVVERLQRQAQLRGLSASALAQRHVDEALRAAEHPGIAFRDGPAGRRAGLLSGPDVWEIVKAVRASVARGPGALSAAAEELSLDVSQVQVATRYYGSFPDEVDAMITANDRAADEAFQAWQAERRLLA